MKDKSIVEQIDYDLMECPYCGNSIIVGLGFNPKARFRVEFKKLEVSE